MGLKLKIVRPYGDPGRSNLDESFFRYDKKEVRPVAAVVAVSDYISSTTLLKYRDVKWTEKAISLFLGQPDKEVQNPRYRSWAKMKLYLTKRVEQVEQSKEFQDFVNKHASKHSKVQCEQAVETNICETGDDAYDSYDGIW